MDDMGILLLVAFLAFFVILFIIDSWGNLQDGKLEELNEELRIKRQELDNLNNQIQNSTLDRGTGLTQAQVKVLDKYERSNIRIPADILEELPHIMHLSESDTLEYIEHQRNHWKLENTKKVYKK